MKRIQMKARYGKIKDKWVNTKNESRPEGRTW